MGLKSGSLDVQFGFVWAIGYWTFFIFCTQESTEGPSQLCQIRRAKLPLEIFSKTKNCHG